ncbi:Hypothetical Protein FCC1311_041232 [Hondaea fermentalgiana]|uniref:Uncharacterized protein n=1 Tax=Hondaea fermentalgiana TaxID=2315210 RepID=A0A2R5GA56_9STRA|nr:Hypothetical Protein FCC1311_041232 [Hondaea fermentalgiana]|eukprot:GBG27900.1 Hypothetical Protein FCC1311_041232 [Hondaea fermentalgiana]
MDQDCEPTTPGPGGGGAGTKTARGHARSLLSLGYDLRLQLLSAGIYAFIASSKAVTFLPFIRTSIECESDQPAVDRHSSHWSGSTACTDLGLVARDAQYMKGWAEGLDQGFHCVALPLLGHAIDCYGRRWGVLVGMLGVFAQCAFFFVAASFGAGNLADALIIMGSIVQGLTGIYMAAVNASLRDTQLAASKANDEGSEAHAFGALQLTQGSFAALAVAVVTGGVIAQNLESYTSVWFGYAMLAAVSSVALYMGFPETLAERQTWQWHKASPLRLVDLVWVDSSQRWVAVMMFFLVFSLSSHATLQAFTIATYHWSQTKSTVALMPLAPIVLLSMGAALFIVPRFSPQNVLMGTFVFLDVASVLFCFAGVGPIFVFVGAGFLLATAGAIPTIMQIIASLAGPDEVGQFLANMGAISLAAVALGNVFFGFVFRTFPKVPELSFLLAAPFMFIATYCALKAKRVFDDLDERRRDQVPLGNGEGVSP